MSDQVVVVAALPIAEGKIDEAIEALTRCQAAVHAEEPGVLKYALHRDAKDPNRLVMVEVYAGQADLDAHAKTSHMAELIGSIGGLLAGRMEMSILTPVAGGDPAKGSLA